MSTKGSKRCLGARAGTKKRSGDEQQRIRRPASKNERTERKKPVAETSKRQTSPVSLNTSEVHRCGVCDQTVKDDGEGILCEGDCQQWFHPHCVHVSEKEYERLSQTEDPWLCELCDTFLSPSQQSQSRRSRMSMQVSENKESDAKDLHSGHNKPDEVSAREHHDLPPQQVREVRELIMKFNKDVVGQANSDLEALTMLVLAMGQKILKQENEINRLNQIVQSQPDIQAETESNFSTRDSQPINPNAISNPNSTHPPFESNASVTNNQIQALQAKVDSLTSSLIREKEREKRKCNILLGNVPEGESLEGDQDKVNAIFQQLFKAECEAVQVRRIGKRNEVKPRLLLVKLKSVEDKIKLLKLAKALRGSDTYLMEDLSKTDREARQKLVKEMKKARSEGKRAYIRFSDGKLIIDGIVFEATANPNPEHANVHA